MLAVSGVSVEIDGSRILDGVDLEVGSEIVAVLGPSGCGKSTLLRAVAGLQQVSTGTISFDGEDLADVPTHRRGFGLMFQDYALFPHRDVGGNVAFGLEMQDLPTDERKRRTTEALELVGLAGFEDRPVADLSGGEAQRVALARAMAPRPRLLMLDEPLGALDRLLRERLIRDIKSILDEAATPAIYVTHDHGEAAAVADRVAVMRAGKVVQVDTLDAIRQSPADDWVRTFVATAGEDRGS